MVNAAPIIGERIGPPITHVTKKAVAIPLVRGEKKSAKAAGPMVTGAEPKMPAKKRVTKMLAASVLVAVPILKRDRKSVV